MRDVKFRSASPANGGLGRNVMRASLLLSRLKKKTDVGQHLSGWNFRTAELSHDRTTKMRDKKNTNARAENHKMTDPFATTRLQNLLMALIGGRLNI